MEFDVILFTILLVLVAGCALRAFFSPLSKNIRRFLAVLLSFGACYAIQQQGLLSPKALLAVLDNPRLAVPENITGLLEASPYLSGLAGGVAASLAASLFIPVLFVLLYLLLRQLLKLVIDLPLSMFRRKKTPLASRIGSAVIGAVGGLFISAVLLMPVFFLVPFGSSLASPLRAVDEQDSPTYRRLAVIEEEFVAPLEDSAAIGIYKALGLCDLMQHTATLSGRVEIEGQTVQADQTMHTILKSAPALLIYLEAEDGNDAVIVEALDALSQDEIITSALADLVQDTLANMDTEKESEQESNALALLTTRFQNSAPEEMKTDIRTLFSAAKLLAEDDFFCDVKKLYTVLTDADETNKAGLVTTLLDNLPLCGRLMDALYEANPDTRLIDMLFDSLMQFKDVRKILTDETIDELHTAVENGETTYEDFTLLLASMLELVENSPS